MSVGGNKPLVSIGMPVYNGERFIRQALDSLLAQDYENFELIISDNASTDGTREICLEYASRDKRIRYYRNEINLGALANLNRVLELAQGPYFMWAAHDDVWEPSYISTLLRDLISDSETVLAFSAFNNINEHGQEVRTYPYLFELPSVNLFQRLWNYLMQEEYLGKANLIYGLMRRSAIQVAGGFKVWGKGLWGADMLVVFRLLSLGNLVLTRDLLFHKRLVSSPSLSHSDSSYKGGITSPIRMISQCCSAIQSWHGYFSGYARIINLTDTLTVKQKAKLQGALWRRASYVYGRETKRTLVLPGVRWLAKRSEYIGFIKRGLI